MTADPRLVAVQRVAGVSRAWAEVAAPALVDRARELLADGLPPRLRDVVGLDREERPMNAALGWLLHPSGDHAGVLSHLAARLGAHALVRDLQRGAHVEPFTQSSPRDWPNGGAPDLLFRGPTGALLIENKVDASETGDNYNLYAAAFGRWAGPREKVLWIFAAAARGVPAPYLFATHAQVAGWLREAASAPGVRTWTRIAAELLAEDLRPRAPTIRALADALRACERSPDPSAVAHLAALTARSPPPLWRPA